MPDYVSLLLNAINKFDPHNTQSVNNLRDLVCWVSDENTHKNDNVIAELLYIASQKMRVFGYNTMNNYDSSPTGHVGALNDLGNQAIVNLYRSKSNPAFILDKSQQEVIDLYQNLAIRRMLVSAPTSYGKTFLMREIIFLNKERYRNILLVFPTVALLLENARTISKFVQDYELDYQVVKTVDAVKEDSSKNMFIFTPERALQLISLFPNLKIDFFFFDEVYKIDEDYCTDDLEDEEEAGAPKKSGGQASEDSFLNEDRGKTFRIALYLLAKSVSEYYLAGPNLNKENFGYGLQQFLRINQVTVKEITFEPTLRISVRAYTRKIKEELPAFIPSPDKKQLVPVNAKVNDKIKDVMSYIDGRDYGKTLLYCTTPTKASEYAQKLLSVLGSDCITDCYPQEFQTFIAHIDCQYDIDGSVQYWCLSKILKNGFGMHHGKLPKYIQHEILEQFNKGTIKVLFCTSTIVEGVNTDAQNMVILNTSKGTSKLTPFDIKNIRGRAGRYHHCFIGRVFYMNKELIDIEQADNLSLNFVTYSDKELSTIDMDNADISDLTAKNAKSKTERDIKTGQYQLPQEVFVKNRTVSKENQEQLLRKLAEADWYQKFRPLLMHSVKLDDFLKYNWITKVLDLFLDARLIDQRIRNKYLAVIIDYTKHGFKGILTYEVKRCTKDNEQQINKAYSAAFKSLKDILEHKIPKILSLFEGIAICVAHQKGDNAETFSLSQVCRYFETGVKSPLGEALIEYGFPVDAIRTIEDSHPCVINFELDDAKSYCRNNFRQISSLLDDYERQLFIKAIKSF